MDSAHREEKSAISTQRLDEAIKRGDKTPPALLSYD